MNRRQAYLFDLDGTLVQTAPEILDAVNDTLLRFGWEPVALNQVERWIGHGTHALLVHALAHACDVPESKVRGSLLLQEAEPVFDDFYRRRCGTRSFLYPQVREVLCTLKEQGCRLAVVTNKEGRYTRAILEIHQLTDAFDLVVAGDTFQVRKPDPSGALYCLEQWSIAPANAVFVGDSSIDAATARNAGMPVWLLTHGYNMGAPVAACAPDRVMNNFLEIL